MSDAIEVVERLYEAYNRRSMADWVAAFADGATWTNVPTGETFVAPEGQAENYSAWNTPFPKGQCVDLKIAGGEGVIVAEFVGDGVNEGPLPGPDGAHLPATGKRVSIPFCDVHQVVDGKIVATRRYWDNAAVAEQLGA